MKKPFVVAHRGFASKYPENTWSAFRAALDHGCSHLELDVQLTKDLVPVVVHDDSLLRVGDKDLSVLESRWGDIQGVSVGENQRLSHSFLNEPLLSLLEFSDLMSAYPDVIVFVEIKQESISQFGVDVVLEKVHNSIKRISDQSVLISFNSEILFKAKEKCRVGYVLSEYNEEALEVARSLCPEFLICNYQKIGDLALWQGQWDWFLYEIEDIKTANDWVQKGVRYIESMRVDELMPIENTSLKLRYDMLIIGGGIHGVGVAHEAASQGYSVVLLEKGELASGTSSKSSKLIHGGLRYLESLQFSLVKECLQDREFLVENYPEIVRLKPFFLPIYSQTRRQSLKIFLGLFLYSLLGGFRKSTRFRKLRKTEWGGLDGLNTGDLKVVYQYFDAQTDDKTLVQTIGDEAKSFGAKLYEQASFLGARKENGTWSVEFKAGGKMHQVSVGVVINAAGPWANEVLEKIEPEPEGLKIDLVKGSHIVVDGSILKGLYYMEVPEDGRAVFAMPWKEKTLVGTTEVNFTGDLDNVSASSEEVSYLLRVLKHYFPKYSDLSENDIVKSFAGLRVLPVSSSNYFSRSRETIFFEDDKNAQGLLTIYGGKLTSFRSSAKKLLKKCQKLGYLN